MRPIDADALKKEIREVYCGDCGSAIEAINNAPTIDPESLAAHLKTLGYEVTKCSQ